MRRTLTILAVGLLAVAVRADDGPVTIKLKQNQPGDKIKEVRSERSSQKTTFSAKGKEATKEQQEVSKFVYTEEVVTRPAGAKRATKLRRTYETAELTRDGQKVDVGLAGKTVVIEKAGDGYAITVEGEEPTGVAAELLKKEFDKEKAVTDEDLLPKEPVKVGGTWKVDVAMLAKDAEGKFEVDVAKSSATGKLVKVYDKGGKKFGVMEITMELAVNKVGGAGQQFEVKPGSRLKMAATMDACIDGTASTVRGKMTMTGAITATVSGNDLKVDLNATQEGSTEDAK